MEKLGLTRINLYAAVEKWQEVKNGTNLSK
jgi:hypothetical protein